MRTAVSGVRSSCEASATRRRCAPTERSSAASIALKRREPAELVAAGICDAFR